MVVSIVVHYNNVPDCRRCVNSLLKVDFKNHFILIVDNCSEEKNYKELISIYKDSVVEIIQTEKNGGFGYGVNRGVEHCDTINNSIRYVHVINSDSEVINYEYIKELNKILDDNEDIGIVGPGVYCNDGTTVQNTILPITSLYSALFFKNKYKNISNITSPPMLTDVDCLNGVCFMVRKDLYKKINGFCEDYFMYNEEQDLCLKIKNSKKRIVFWSGKSIIHYGASNTSLTVPEILNWRYMYNRRNQVMFIRKNKNCFEASVLAFIFILFSVPKFLNKKNQKDISWLSFVKQLVFALK